MNGDFEQEKLSVNIGDLVGTLWEQQNSDVQGA